MFVTCFFFMQCNSTGMLFCFYSFQFFYFFLFFFSASYWCEHLTVQTFQTAECRCRRRRRLGLLLFLNYFVVFFRKHKTLLSVKGCMNGKHKLFFEVLTVPLWFPLKCWSLCKRGRRKKNNYAPLPFPFNICLSCVLLFNDCSACWDCKLISVVFYCHEGLLK